MVRVVREKDFVKVDYITEVEGKVVDTSLEDEAKKHGIFNSFKVYEPISFEVGSGDVVEGFDRGIRGMKVGDYKEFEVEPEAAYGKRNEKLVLELDKKKFKNKKLYIGREVVLKLPDNNKVKARVIKIGKDKVKVDINHELAGKTLKFKIWLREII